MTTTRMDLKCEGEQAPDGTWTVTVTATGLASVEQAHRIAQWLRKSLMQNVGEIGQGAS